MTGNLNGFFGITLTDLNSGGSSTTGLDLWGASSSHIGYLKYNLSSGVMSLMNVLNLPVVLGANNSNVLWVNGGGTVGIGGAGGTEKLQITSGNVLVSNNYGYNGLSSGSVSTNLIKIDASNNIQLGDLSGTVANTFEFWNDVGGGSIQMYMSAAGHWGMKVGTSLVSGAVLTVGGVASINSGTNVVYYCSNGGYLARGNGGTCSGGSWTATSLWTD